MMAATNAVNIKGESAVGLYCNLGEDMAKISSCYIAFRV